MNREGADVASVIIDALGPGGNSRDAANLFFNAANGLKPMPADELAGLYPAEEAAEDDEDEAECEVEDDWRTLRTDDERRRGHGFVEQGSAACMAQL